MSTLTPASSILNTCPDPLQRRLPIRFRQKFVPLGKVIQVETNDSRILQAAVESFGCYGEAPLVAQPHIFIELCVDPIAEDEGPWVPPVYRGRQHLFHIHCGPANFAVADLRTGIAVGFVSHGMACDRSFFRNAFLECLFYILAVHQSHTPVHCSCVSLDNRGVLICGNSGAGKSTLAYACVQSGMQLVSDDSVHLEWSSPLETPRLWGTPWILRLLPETSEFFQELSGRRPHLRSNHEWCVEVDVTREFPGKARTSCEPAALVFLERGKTEILECTPVEPSTALERLRQDIVLDEEPVVNRHYRALRRLVETGAYTLKYSGHPLSAVGAIKNLLLR